MAIHGKSQKTIACLPVKLVRRLQLRNVERATLLNELETAGSRRGVIEGDEHHVGEVHARERYIEDARGGLDLSGQSMRGTTEHHHGPRELADELLALNDLRNVASDLFNTGVTGS